MHCRCYGRLQEQFYKFRDLKPFLSFDFSREQKYRSVEYLNQIVPYITFGLFSFDKESEKEIKLFMQKIYQMGVPYVLVTRSIKDPIFYDGNITLVR